jgi:hypothetical protein
MAREKDPTGEIEYHVADLSTSLPGGPGRFDVVGSYLVLNDVADYRGFIATVAAALKPGGQVAIVEFVPNPDRVSPPIPAAFALTMLAGTPAGDVYTFDDLNEMLRNAGFRDARAHALPTPQTVVVAKK